MPKKTEKLDKQKHFADQFDDEEVLFVFRKHPIVMRKGLILSMLAILLGTIPALIKPEISYFFGGLAAGFLLGLLLFSPSWISWFYSVFIVTDQRLIQITQKGLFHRSVVDLGLNQIQMVNYQIGGLQQTLLGFGTIMMQTYVGDLIIHDVHHPAKIQKKILSILRGQGIISVNGPYNKTTKDEKDENETEEDT
jgi:Bacterial PH domain